MVVAVGRNPETLPYLEELRQAGATIAFTRHGDGDRPAGPPSREEVLPLLDSVELFYVCGSPRFAEYAVPLLLDCGADPTGDSRRAVRSYRLKHESHRTSLAIGRSLAVIARDPGLQ